MKKQKKIFFIIGIVMLLVIPFANVFAEDEALLTCNDVKHFTSVYTFLRILAPALLILFGSLDFFKAIMAGDVKKQQEARSKFPKRIIALVLLIVLPFVVSFLFTTFGTAGSQNTGILCCILSNGNENCEIGLYSTGGSNNPNNADYVNETADNMPGGSNYVSPVTRRVNAKVSTCINNYYGECSNVNVSTQKCDCTYVSREDLSSEALCDNDPYHVGKSVRQEGGNGGGKVHVTCYYNARLSETSSTISNIKGLPTSPNFIGQIKTKNGSTSFDGYWSYERKVKNTSAEECSSLENHSMYCSGGSSNCICIYGKGIIPSSQASSSDYQQNNNQRAQHNAKKNRYNELVDILNEAQRQGSIYYNSGINTAINGDLIPDCVTYPVHGSLVAVARKLTENKNDLTYSIGDYYNQACDESNASSGNKSCIIDYYNSFGVDVNNGAMTINSYGDAVTTANNLINTLNEHYWTNGYNVFLANIDEFNQLRSYFNLSSASISDFNTNILYEKVE